MTYKGLHTVISGGQTGADQGGLLAAFRMGLKTGGTAPSSFHTERGKQPLLECLGLKAQGDYRARTIKNVTDSDGTVLLSATLESPGSKLTRNEANRQRKPFIEFGTAAIQDGYLARQLGHITDVELRDLIDPVSRALCLWLISNNVGTLNVAGNRDKGESTTSTYSTCAILHVTFELLHVEDLLIRKL